VARRKPQSAFVPAYRLFLIGSRMDGLAYAPHRESFVGLGMSQGLSGREMLRVTREAGYRVSDRLMYRAMTAVRAGVADTRQIKSRSRANRGTGIDLYKVPSRSQFNTWEGTRRRGYLYRFRTFWENVDARLGGYDVIKSTYTTRTVLVSTELLKLWFIIAGDPDFDFSKYDYFLAGISLYSLTEMVPNRR
jgi:hypothetical protein